jgi:hypothetical protein
MQLWQVDEQKYLFYWHNILLYQFLEIIIGKLDKRYLLSTTYQNGVFALHILCRLV